LPEARRTSLRLLLKTDMYIDILNSDNSKISEEGEILALRTALLLSDKAGFAGKNYFFLNAENEFKNYGEKQRANQVNRWYKAINKEDPESSKLVEDMINCYKRTLLFKQKDKSAMLLIAEGKSFVDRCQEIVFNRFKLLAKLDKYYNLIQYHQGNRHPLILTFLDSNARANIKIVNHAILPKEDIMILDKTAFEAADAVDINNFACKDNAFNSGKHTIFYGEIITLPDLGDLAPEHFDLIRNNFIKGTSSFRQALLLCKETSFQTLFSVENFRFFLDSYNKIKNEARTFEKLADENTLLNELKAGETKFPVDKIYLAFTSIENLIFIFENLGVLNETESLYIRMEISVKANLKAAIPFLIVDQENILP